jgi:uncharacterized protein (DUF2344 family)
MKEAGYEWDADKKELKKMEVADKESEDERNIKELISELKCSLRAAICQNDACGGGHEKIIALLEWSIAWFEKQGKKIDDAYLQGICDAKHEIEKQGKKVDAAEVIEWIKNYASLFAANWAILDDVIEQFKRDFKL